MKITARGQVTIPRRLLELAGLEPAAPRASRPAPMRGPTTEEEERGRK